MKLCDCEHPGWCGGDIPGVVMCRLTCTCPPGRCYSRPGCQWTALTAVLAAREKQEDERNGIG